MKMWSVSWELVALTWLMAWIRPHSCDGDKFTALVDLQNLLGTQTQIITHIDKYLHAEEKRLHTIRQHAKQYSLMLAEAENDVERFVSNPINAYLLVKRLTTDWQSVKTLMTSDSNVEEFLASVEDGGDGFPSQGDLEGAVQALIRLQDTYKLDTADIASGSIQGTTNSPALMAGDCFELGRQSYMKGDHYHTVLWMQETLRRADNEANKTIERADILEYLAYSTFMQGNTKVALKLTNELLELVPQHKRANGNKAHYEYMLKEDSSGEKRGDDGDKESDKQSDSNEDTDYLPEREKYENLCREEIPLSKAREAKLKCFYHTNQKKGILLLQPQKVEVVFDRPTVWRLHDILLDYQMDFVKELATPRLRRATARNHATGNFEPVHYRISKSAWLRRHEHPVIESIWTRVEAITHLNMESSEDLQVVNYGIGGHYEPHFDFARSDELNAFEEEEGNRIATVLFYMSDVDAGGATVFPTVGARLSPEKGSAVFWWNLKKSGEGDYTTRHAACPVLSGSKWVANFWVHERGQEFRRPCGLSEEE